MAANVSWVMAVNPDPKPGRWILPLVILGMIGFTYFFVRELPEASTDTTLASGTTTTTALDSTSTTTPVPTDPEIQAYVDQVSQINDELQVLRTELEAVNTGFDATPRQVEYPDAVTRFEAVEAAAGALADRFGALIPPTALSPNHNVLLTEIGFAANAAVDALAGLTSDDPGLIRRNAVEAFGTAADNFTEEVAILVGAAVDAG